MREGILALPVRTMEQPSKDECGSRLIAHGNPFTLSKKKIPKNERKKSGLDFHVANSPVFCVVFRRRLPHGGHGVSVTQARWNRSIILSSRRIPAGAGTFIPRRGRSLASVQSRRRTRHQRPRAMAMVRWCRHRRCSVLVP